MRKFTDSENRLIQQLVYTKRKGLNSILDLQMTKILRKEFSFFALKCTYGEFPQITLYNRRGAEKKDVLDKQYYAICDFIYFIKELEALGFIALQNVSSKNEESGYDIFYDREKYKYIRQCDGEKDRFESKQPIDKKILNCVPEESLVEEDSSGIYTLSLIDKSTIYSDFANDLHKYGLPIIYPLPLAEDYVENGCQTLEELHHDAQMKVALRSARISQWGLFIAILSFLFSMIIGCTKECSHMISEEVQGTENIANF